MQNQNAHRQREEEEEEAAVEVRIGAVDDGLQYHSHCLGQNHCFQRGFDIAAILSRHGRAGALDAERVAPNRAGYEAMVRVRYAFGRLERSRLEASGISRR